MTEITLRPFGKTSGGQDVTACILRAGEYSVQVLTLGGIIQSFIVPAPDGPRDIVLGCDTPEQYEAQSNYLGAMIGRVANRIGGAAFLLNGRKYLLDANDRGNCLHGGIHGFDSVLWKIGIRDGVLTLSYVSSDGDGGFPGTLHVQISYSLSESGVLTLDYLAQSDVDTLCNLTNHSYFNLLGHSAGTLEGQQVQIFADAITAIDRNGIPSGELLRVEGTPFDLRQPTDISESIYDQHPQIKAGAGYDHNFVLHHRPCGPLQLAARAFGGGLCLECLTTQPGLQLYTANGMDRTVGKHGAVYGRRSAFCLETQAWPDAIHHARFPSPVLCAGETYHQTTVYHVSR